MVAAAVIAGGAAIAGGAMASSASKKAAKTQAASADQASAIQQANFEQTREDLMPYKQAGDTSLKQLMGQMGSNGYFNQSYEGDKFNFQADPSYKFRQQQGFDGIQSQAAAQGGLLSGATLKALNDYNSNLASQEYGNAFNRWQSTDNNNYERFNADQTNRYNRLSNLVGVGQNAAAQVGNAGAQTSQAIANNTMAGANSIAAGQVGSANAWSNTANDLGSMAAAYGIMNKKGVI
ncbi:DNA transfer protein p32 [Acinetobacter johnsonii]|uniref:DNA transfer protein p32 n=1 Tax=Acinetobacter johnsonii TaxID=40214 RepID=UPI001F1F039E|nr:DNA transfer protein p32 [Acinetobacter johnsonii]MCF7642934.1 DNA transfer protein p32 [Acinetobacter johnsonii]